MKSRKGPSRSRAKTTTASAGRRLPAPKAAAGSKRETTRPASQRARQHRLFVIGAGASYAAGLPDASRLPAQVFGYIGNAPWEVVRNRPPQAYFDPLSAVLQSVLRELSTGGPQGRWPMDAVFERFGELIREDPQRFGTAFGQLFEATAQLLYQRSQYGARSEAYRRFVHALTEDDLILSFNWDVCLEIAMEHAARPLQRSLRPQRRTGPWLLKLNGSIDHLIVNTSRFGNGIPPRGRARDPRSWWTQFPFLERLNLTAPSPPATGRAAPAPRYELARLRTYDLAGFEMRISAAEMQSIGKEKIDENVYDVGPFALTHALPECPSIHMIGPGTPPGLSRWYLEAVRSAVAPAAAGLTSIYVIGYSFPVYDLPVIRLLRDIVQAADDPPAHVVNPDAAELPRQPLQFIFGKGPLQLHPCGFEAFEWS